MTIEGTKILLIKNDSLLLHLRDDKKEIPNPNVWSLIGGDIGKGETLTESICREVKEEIGYVIKDPKLFLEHHGQCNGAEVITHLFEAIMDKEVDELTLTEGQEIRFFNYEEAQKIDIAPIYREVILEKLKKLESLGKIDE